MVIFLLVKSVNNLKRKHEDKNAAPAANETNALLKDIRDLLSRK